MNDLFLLSGAVGHEPAIDIWLDGRAPRLGAMAREWFVRMRDCGEDVLKLMHDGCPVVCVGEAPFAYGNVFRAHANVGFFRGADLPDPVGLLEGKGRLMRHVKLRPDEAVDAKALADLIRAAYADIKHRLGVSTLDR